MSTVLVAHPSPDLYGSDRMLLESLDAMVGAGDRVVVTLPETGPLVDEIERRGATVRFCRTPILRRAYMKPSGVLRLGADTLGAVRPGLALIREVRPDVMYVSTLTAPEWLLLAKRSRVPAVCHVHEAESTAPWAIRWALAAPLRLADHLIVNSRFSERVITDVIPSLKSRSTVVYNGVVGPPERAPLRHELGEAPALLFVGRLSERKGIFDALDAVKVLHERGVPATLDVAGSIYPGYEYVQEGIGERVAALDDPSSVRLHGFVSDIWPLLAGADILLVPSQGDEPFGNTAVEGTLAGRPVVASASTGLLEAVADVRAARSVTPRDLSAIADAVADLTANWATVREQAVDDAEMAAARYSPELYGERIMALLTSVGKP